MEKLNYKKIEKLWNTYEYTMEDISKIMGVSRERIRQVMQKMRLQGYSLLTAEELRLKIKESKNFIKDCNNFSNLIKTSKRKHYSSYIYRRKLIKLDLMKECMLCGYNERSILEIHHEDEDRNNNAIKNLIVVCPNCHKLIHLNKKSKGLNYKYNKYMKEHRYKSIL